MKKKPIVFFDIDFTIFDTAQLRKNRYQLLAKRLGYDDVEAFYSLARQVEKETKEKAGHFDPKVFLSLVLKKAKKKANVDDLEKSFLDPSVYDMLLYEDTRGVFEKLIENNIEIGILSTGQKEFQLYKLQKVRHLLKEEHIHIFSDKLQFLQDIVRNYADKHIFLIDDMLHVLYEAKKLDPTITTLLIKRSKSFENPLFYDQQQSNSAFKPDKVIATVKEIVPLVI